MALLDQDLREILAERELLEEVEALARRCGGCPPPRILDAVLRGTRVARPLVPSQRGRS